ncbi:P-loop containing nucleoside triphosphate hydrolase protein [Truncatella angustata]|uniref:P-loop containing nucleoside triphosphate hydrolase protein n=1 Tax=Truncatella angustata TaxID=152316 RepID=A0A9P8RJN4_9PEZI|nr:P-loop containing nucleoside triphosphate hydrolase protein [Truncatella angustata]KAH6640030.1 P-loop containing nucleoside triphosphate hydrolase protein [Truncatella angustata]KAH8200527.1 hypothetical protein TruAng_005304 [Truncatella angustata]
MSDGGSSIQYQRSIGTSSDLSKMIESTKYNAEFSLGMRPEIKQLYRTDGRSHWDDWDPENTPMDVEASSYAQECALIVRKLPQQDTHQIALDSITVQSPLIKNVLNLVFEGYEGLDTRLKQLTFSAPFHPFYYRWHRLRKVRDDEQDYDTKVHIDLLYTILKQEILPHIEAMEDFVKNEAINYNYLWTIFAPGMELYSKVNSQDRMFLLTNTSYGGNMSGEFFSLDCQYIDCDGSTFGHITTSIDIYKFEGVKKITELDVFPCHLHHDAEGVVERLHARGEKSEQLNGLHHVMYSGFYTTTSSKQARKRYVEKGRIIIDPHTFKIYGMGNHDLESTVTGSPIVSSNDDDFGYSMIHKATSQALHRFMATLEKFERQKMADLQHSSNYLTPRQRLLCTPYIRGYCLRTKAWAEFHVENVSPVFWSEDAFTKLVLPHGYKDIIRAFVQEQLSREDDFDDIIYGKGRGFIMLLSGDPGIGKTLTAESVAEEMHQPLYSMSAGELGETATEVEESLDKVLELVSKWNAILLLDECDMFVEARTATDIRRNRLISIFLKKLEYYQGVMFLTTNHISNFDAAFESRIHLTIRYPALDAKSRLLIWKTFAEGGNTESRLSDSDLELVAKHDLNGRQIKNIMKASRLLSRQRRESLSIDHVEIVLRVKQGNFISSN